MNEEKATNNGNGGPDFYESFFEKTKVTTFLLFMLAVTALVLGRTYYVRETRDPMHCASCHMKTEVFAGWQKENSRNNCLDCHNLNVSDHNRHLVAFVSGGNASFKEVCRQGIPGQNPDMLYAGAGVGKENGVLIKENVVYSKENELLLAYKRHR